MKFSIYVNICIISLLLLHIFDIIEKAELKADYSMLYSKIAELESKIESMEVVE